MFQILIINGKQPFCAEPPSSELVKNFISPSDTFYVRNHLPVPLVDIEDYELELALEDETVKSLNLDDLKKFPKYSVVSTIMCGGNRRSEMADAKPLRGLSWSVGAVGNAKWSGARLCDVLNELGLLLINFIKISQVSMKVNKKILLIFVIKKFPSLTKNVTCLNKL